MGIGIIVQSTFLRNSRFIGKVGQSAFFTINFLYLLSFANKVLAQCPDPVQPSTLSVENKGVTCPGEGQNVGLDATFDTQYYTFRRNGIIVNTDLTKKKGKGDGSGLSYTIQNMTFSEAGTYSVTITNACGDSIVSNSVTVYNNIITGLGINSIQDVSVNFKWNKLAPGISYDYAVVQDTSVSPPPSDQTSDTSIVVSGLNPGTTYYIYVGSQCVSGNETWVKMSFKTANAPCIPFVQIVPSITTTGGITSFCNGQNLVLNSSSSLNNQWYKDSARITGSTAATLNVSVGGKYMVQLFDASGCSTFSTEKVITVSAVPAIPTISPSNPSAICAGDSIILISSAAGGNQWYKDAVAISGEINIKYKSVSSGNYSVKTTNSGGCSANSTEVSVSVNLKPAKPSIIALGVTTFCTGDSVTFNSDATAGNQWYLNNTLQPAKTAPSLIAKSSGFYKVQVTNSGICPVFSDSIFVTVNTSQSAPLITTANPLLICSGDSVVLNSSATANNQWYRDGNIMTGETTAKYTAYLGGNYTVKLTNAGTCTDFSIPVTITINATPAVPVITPVGSTSFCSGDSVILNSNAAIGNQWYKDGLQISGSIQTSIVAKTSGNYLVRVSNGTCSVSSVPVSVNNINIQSPPTISPAGSVSICNSDSTVFTSSAATGNQWLLNGTVIPGAIFQKYTTYAAGAYSVVLTGGGGCNANSISTYVSIAIAPAIPVISEKDSLINCNPVKLLISSATTGNQWLQNGIAIAGEISNSYTINKTGTYSLQVKNAAGCTALSEAINITSLANPVVVNITTSDPLTFCAGGKALLSSSSPTGNQWYKDGIVIAGATGQTYTAIIPGKYTVQISINTCILVSGAVNISVINNQILPEVTPAGPLTFCIGDTIKLTSSSNSGNQWYKDGVLINGEVNNFFNATAAGSYTVKISSGNCSSNFSAPVIVQINNIQTVPVITSGGSLDFCAGGSVILTSSDAVNYQWSQYGTVIPGANSKTYTVKIAGSYTVKTNYSSACGVTSQPKVITITNTPAAPSISIEQIGSGCNAVFQLSSSEENNNQWLKDAVVIQGAIAKTYLTTDPGKYSVALGYGTNCTSVSEAVTIVPVTSPALKAIIKMFNGSLASDSISGNQWYLNDTLILDATNYYYNPVIAGKYTLRISYNGCISDFSEPFIVSETDVITPNVRIFPNPVTDMITIFNLLNQPATAQIFDMEGRLILTKKILTGSQQIHCAQFPNGDYVILITDEKTKKQSRKLFVKL